MSSVLPGCSMEYQDCPETWPVSAPTQHLVQHCYPLQNSALRLWSIINAQSCSQPDDHPTDIIPSGSVSITRPGMVQNNQTAENDSTITNRTGTRKNLRTSLPSNQHKNSTERSSFTSAPFCKPEMVRSMLRPRVINDCQMSPCNAFGLFSAALVKLICTWKGN